MSTPVINIKGIPITEVMLGFTYRVNDSNNWLHEQIGKCVAVFPSRNVVALYINGKAHNVFPEDLTLVSKTA